MTSLFAKLAADDRGFIVSAELVLIATIVVLGLLVGLSELANSVNQELEDVGSAFGSINQTYAFSGNAGHKGYHKGSFFEDQFDHCDGEHDIHCDVPPQPERRK